MYGYQADRLKEYINETEELTINNDLHIRLSRDLLKKYYQGLYEESIKQISNHIREIKKLEIKYPANANPIFYLYIVPVENFRELLNFPSKYINSQGGGRPVTCYDLNGFNDAFGVSSNLMENRKDESLMQKINSIHELAHLVHGMFFNKDRLLSEGFAEALPLYTMDYESLWDEHRETLKALKKELILSAQQLIEISKDKNFNIGVASPNKSCSFEYSYISSYLFVRGCLETISNKYKVDRAQATQKFLEIVRQSKSFQQWLIFDIANAIGIPQEELLYKKELQINILQNLEKK